MRLANVFKEEPNFSDWLSKNMEILGDVIGDSFVSSPASTEVRESPENGIGRYPADILGITQEGKKVVVENQYGITDHIHLGEILTYSSWLNVDKMVWIAEGLDKEHFRAVECLRTKYGMDIVIVLASIGQNGEVKLKLAQKTDITEKEKNSFVPMNHELLGQFWKEFVESSNLGEDVKCVVAGRKDSANITWSGRNCHINAATRIRSGNIKVELQYKKDEKGKYYEMLNNMDVCIHDYMSEILSDYDSYEIVEPSPKGVSQLRVTLSADLENPAKWSGYIYTMRLVINALIEISRKCEEEF